MTKQEFLGQLEQALSVLPADEVKDIVYDYAEHIQVALERGEEEATILEKLGSPKAIAKEYTLNHYIETAKTKPSGRNYSRVLLAAVGLGFFNLTFVLGPFIGAWAVLLSFFASGAALVLSAVAVIAATVLYPLGITTGLTGSPWEFIALFGIAAALGAIGLLIMLGTALASKWFYSVTLKYLQLNHKVLTGSEGR